MSDDLRRLPEDLPVPKDDGAAAHLHRKSLPDLNINCSNGATVNLKNMVGPVVLYCFPMMAKSTTELPSAWNALPGARGCTVQSLRYTDELSELLSRGATVYGVSTETQDRQIEAVKRLQLRHALLSDSEHRLIDALRLPTFELETRAYLRRVTLGAYDGQIERVWYPIFPPGDEIAEVIAWLTSLGADKGSPAAIKNGQARRQPVEMEHAPR